MSSIRGWGWPVLIALMLAVSGCVGGPRSEGIASVRLECAAWCKAMDHPPFTEKTFDGRTRAALRVFRDALRKAEPMGGSIDYDASFWMYVTYKGGEVRKFTLNISDEPGRNGMIVDMAKSDKGFRIPKADTEALRQILFRS